MVINTRDHIKPLSDSKWLLYFPGLGFLKKWARGMDIAYSCVTLPSKFGHGEFHMNWPCTDASSEGGNSGMDTTYSCFTITILPFMLIVEGIYKGMDATLKYVTLPSAIGT